MSENITEPERTLTLLQAGIGPGQLSWVFQWDSLLALPFSFFFYEDYFSFLSLIFFFYFATLCKQILVMRLYGQWGHIHHNDGGWECMVGV